MKEVAEQLEVEEDGAKRAQLAAELETRQRKLDDLMEQFAVRGLPACREREAGAAAAGGRSWQPLLTRWECVSLRMCVCLRVRQLPPRGPYGMPWAPSTADLGWYQQ